MGLTPRLAARVRRDFPDPADAEAVTASVAGATASERVGAAIVLAAAGRLDDVRAGADLARLDWRDVLVNGGLAHADWSDVLDRVLGPT